MLRQFMLTLWNTYGFFVTYANSMVAAGLRGMGDGGCRLEDPSP